MKAVPLRKIMLKDKDGSQRKNPDKTDAYLDTREIIEAVVKDASRTGANVSDMRERIRILDALDGTGISEILRLEDNDHKKLCSLIESYPGFVMIDKELLGIIDDILKAKPIEAPKAVAA